MNDKIDLVVPFLNPESKTWQADFKKYSNQAGLKSDNRFRDWGTMKYFFRSLEKNCPWLNKIHLILYDESMVPEWLNTENPKLHIVYHRDYIPEKYLPTFSSSVIEMFIHKIPGLAENFIYSCDDMLFCKPIPEDYFFRNNKTVSPLNRVTNKYQSITEEWNYIENNNIDIIKKITGTICNCNHPHFQIALKKSLIEFVWYKFKDEFEAGLSHSKFRNRYENQIWLFDDIQRLTKLAITNDDIFKNAKYLSKANSNSFYKFKDKNIICFNDVDSQKNYNEVKKEFIKFMTNLFPKKSSFEK